VWTWIAIDADTKLIPSWAVGRRDGFTAAAFIADLAARLSTRIQLTTDGHKAYLEAVEGAFGNAIDYAMLIRMYEGDSGKRASAERRYSPAVCTGSREQTITGNPDAAHISTSYVERQNLTMRMKHPPLYAADERVFKEGRQQQGGPGALLHALQFRADSQDAARNAGHGGGRVGSRMVAG
jgi:hypothetical protein